MRCIQAHSEQKRKQSFRNDEGGHVRLSSYAAHMSEVAVPSLRRDAQRNLELVLAAAATVFGRRGLGATLEEVATAAGVGVGTIYRRFPNKDALIQAVFERELDNNVELLAECLQLPTGWEGLCALLRRGLDQQAADRGMSEFAFSAAIVGGPLAAVRRRVEPMMAELIRRAQIEGALRHDFTVNDVPVITFTLTRLAHTHPDLGLDLARRYLEILLAGLAPHEGAAPLPGRLDDEAYSRWLTDLPT
jgi:AcrR family transcriptional regulator